MKLTITSLEGIVRNEDIKQLTVDTMNGQITILPGHDNLISVLKPGIIKLVALEPQADRKFSFLQDKEFVVFGILGGVCVIQGNEVQLLTNMVLLDNTNPMEFLQDAKQKLVHKLHTLDTDRVRDDDYDIEFQIQKIDVEMKLAMRKNK